MAEQYSMQATYRLVDFWAMERFDDPRFNTEPHRPDDPGANGHNIHSMRKIDPSLRSPKQALDLLADHNGIFHKEHSSVRAIEGSYHQETLTMDGSHYGELDLPFCMKLGFEDYVSMGRPERITVSLEVKVIK